MNQANNTLSQAYRDQLRDAANHQPAVIGTPRSEAAPQSLSEMDRIMLGLADALDFLHAQAVAVEEIYGKFSGEYSSGAPTPTATGKEGLQIGAGHVSGLSMLSKALHARISATDAVIAKLDALI